MQGNYPPLKCVATLENTDMDIRKSPRDCQLQTKQQARLFIPPPVGEDVTCGLLANWENFFYNERKMT